MVAGGEYSDVLEQDVLVVVQPVLHHCQLVGLFKSNAADVFLTLISVDCLVCIMQTRSHSQQMLWPTILMLCLERILLMQLNDVQASGALNLLRIIILLTCTIFCP